MAILGFHSAVVGVISRHGDMVDVDSPGTMRTYHEARDHR